MSNRVWSGENVHCPDCHAELPESVRFCGYCGYEFGETVPGSAPDAPAPDAPAPGAAAAPTAIDRFAPTGATRRIEASPPQRNLPRPDPVSSSSSPSTGSRPRRRWRFAVFGVVAAVAVAAVVVVAAGGGEEDDDAAVEPTTVAPTTAPTTTAVSTTAATVNTEPVGVRFNVLNEGQTGSCNDDPDYLECGAAVTAPAIPFHIAHGFYRDPGQSITDVENAGNAFELYLDNEQLIPDAVLDYDVDSGDPAVTYLFQFPSGLVGEHSFGAVWIEAGEVVVYIDLLVDFQ